MKNRFSAEQIVAILSQAELWIPVAELVRQVAVLQQTFLPVKEETQQHSGRPGPGAELESGGKCTSETDCGGSDAG